MPATAQLLDRLHSYGTEDAEAAALEIKRLHAKLAQIVTVIDDNEATGDKYLTLKFIRNVATT